MMCKDFRFYLGMQNNGFLIKGHNERRVVTTKIPDFKASSLDSSGKRSIGYFQIKFAPHLAPFSFNIRFGNFLQRTTEFPDQKLRFPFLRVCYKPLPSHRL